VVVVDGGSTDATTEIAERRGVRIEELRSPGLYAALNAGFAVVKGAWLTWINADDLLYASTAAARLEQPDDADVLYGPVDFIDSDGRFVHCWTSASPADMLRLYQAGYSPLLQQGTLFRRQVFEQLGGFDETYHFVGDADFWWRALEAGNSFRACAHPPVAAFRLHTGQLSHRYAGPMRAEHDRMVAAHGGRRLSLRSWLALCRLRGRNLPSYCVRCLRRWDLEGHVRPVTSYDIPRCDG
jgi:glycosyltransferase involved in cell wall biosynthesis